MFATSGTCNVFWTTNPPKFYAPLTSLWGSS